MNHAHNSIQINSEGSVRVGWPHWVSKINDNLRARRKLRFMTEEVSQLPSGTQQAISALIIKDFDRLEQLLAFRKDIDLTSKSFKETTNHVFAKGCYDGDVGVTKRLLEWQPGLISDSDAHDMLESAVILGNAASAQAIALARPELLTKAKTVQLLLPDLSRQEAPSYTPIETAIRYKQFNIALALTSILLEHRDDPRFQMTCRTILNSLVPSAVAPIYEYLKTAVSNMVDKPQSEQEQRPGGCFAQRIIDERSRLGHVDGPKPK